MVTEPIIKQDETSTNVNFGADNPQVNTGHHSGSTAQPIPILGQNPAQQPPQMAASHEQAPNTMGDYTSRIVKDKGDYFSHDKKGYYRKDGKTYQITDAPEGDVELDADQTAKLDQSRAEKAERERAEKEGPIITDQVPSGAVERGEPPVDYEEVAKIPVDSPFNKLDKDTQDDILAAAFAVAPGLGALRLGKDVGVLVGTLAQPSIKAGIKEYNKPKQSQ